MLLLFFGVRNFFDKKKEKVKYFFTRYMFFTDSKQLNEIIVECLLGGEGVEGKEICAYVKKQKPIVSKQAIYFALRKLIGELVVFKVDKKYMVNRFWKEKMLNLFQQGKQNLLLSALSEGSVLSYRFSNLSLGYFYWAHVLNDLLRIVPKGSDVLLLGQHHWFIMRDGEVERETLRGLLEGGNAVYSFAAGDGALDVVTKKILDFDWLQMVIGQRNLVPMEQYFSVMNDYIIKLSLTEETASAIESFYQVNDEVTKESRMLFAELMNDSAPVRMKIIRNATKAEKLQKKVMKYF